MKYRPCVPVAIAWVVLASGLVDCRQPPAGASAALRRGLDTADSNQHDEKESYRAYSLWTAQEIRDKLYEWQDTYPEFVKLTTSQEAYGLPRAGGSKDCPYDEGDGCPNYILTIQDYAVSPPNSESSNALPEVMWSGCLHGNERVGPTAVMEATSLLLEAAACEAKPNKQSGKNHVGHAIHDGQTWENELRAAQKCRTALEKKGISQSQRQWLARLLATRRIVVIPTANALGYFRNQREEDGIDPNRDFPFDVKDATKCMQTIAGRTFNEVFREHMFQLSLTFHGGMEVVAYEWGAPTYLEHFSPDDEAQAQIASAYSRFGGGWKFSKPYDFGTMNDKVYYVEGGMEDWAYAGSWDPDRVIECQPKQFGGYAASKTKYGNSTLRVFNMLVETSDKKEPKTGLGTSQDVLSKNPEGNGHISRNIRLALLAADLVEPYVSILSANELALSDDVIPGAHRDDRTSCQRIKAVMVPQNLQQVTISWTVGGAMSIDETSLLYGKWSDLSKKAPNCMTQPDASDLSKLRELHAENAVSGKGFFSEDGPSPGRLDGSNNKDSALGPLFRATLDLSDYQPQDQIVVLARARVDQSWQEQPDNISPKVPPQSHVVNARTNPEWHHEISSGKVVQGRLDWYTVVPLTIVIGDYIDSVGSQSGRQVGTIELSNRFGQTTGGTKGGISPAGYSGSSQGMTWKGLGGIAAILFVSGIVCAFAVQHRRDKQHQRLVQELIREEEGRFEGSSKKPYSDYVEENHDELEDEEEEYGLEDREDGDVELAERYN